MMFKNKKYVFTVFSSLFVIVGTVALNMSGNKKDDTYEYHYGKVLLGKQEAVFHVFNITNPFDEVLYIKDVKESCNCLLTTLNSRMIPPKSNLEIPITMKLKNYLGLQDSTVILFTGNHKLPRITLGMSAEIYAPVQLIPQYVAFGGVKAGEKESKVVKIVINDKILSGQDIITSILNPSTNITLKKSRPDELIVEVLGTSKMEEENTVAKINTTVSELPTLDLNIRVIHLGSIETDPAVVMLSKTKLSQSMKISFLERIDNPSIEIDPAGNSPFKIWNLKKQDDNIINLDISLNSDYEGGSAKAFLRIANNGVSRVIPVYFSGIK